MKNVCYNWSEINQENFSISRIKGLKYSHQITQPFQASKQNPNHPSRSQLRYLRNIKYINKCLINTSFPTNNVLKEHFRFSKNSIQKISLNYPEGFSSQTETLNLNKLLYSGKSISILHFIENSISSNAPEIEKFLGNISQRNPIKRQKTLLPKQFQLQFELRSTKVDSKPIHPSNVQGNSPPFMMKICYNLTQDKMLYCEDISQIPWKMTCVDLFMMPQSLGNIGLEEFIGRFKEIEALTVRIDGEGKDKGKELFEFFSKENAVKRLDIRAENIDFDPRYLENLVFSKGLESLGFVIRTEKMAEDEKTMGYFLKFGQKINELKGLKGLKLGLPTSFYVNQMIHDMKEGTKDRLERIDLEFVEDKKHEIYEEFYVNSCIEWLGSMKNLRDVTLRTTKLNYTYCSYLGKMGNMENIKRFVWIDDSFEKIRTGKIDYKTRIWVECKKPDDLGIVLGIISPEEVEEVEIPLAFDGLSGDFGFRRFVEVGKKMKKLKKLKVYIGFKLLEEGNIKLVEDGLKELGGEMKRDIVGFVCYREMTKEAREYMERIDAERLLRRKNYRLHFVLCP